MRTGKFLVPFVTLTMLGASPSWAWSHVTGTVTTINRNTREIVLDSGRTYTLQTNVSLTDLAAGDKVTVNTEIQNGRHVVNEVTKDD